MPSDLAAATVVVTGVAGRLGQVWAGAFLRAGAHVFGLDRVEPEDAALRAAAAQGGGRFVYHHGDVTHLPGLREALAACLVECGPPHVLVNNAGIDQPPSASAAGYLFEDLPEELSAAVLDVNAAGVLRMCQVFGAEMVRHRRGAIVNVGSLYATVAPDVRFYDHIEMDPPFLKPPAYGMSKAGVAALTRYLATLWGPYGVRVNVLSPGGVLGDQDPLFLRKFVDRVPLGRLARAEDLIGPMLFLASDQSRYVTGTELLVDGGFVCW
ncbi:short-chain dehydrogenase [Pilimelia terevasa]|uniref:Short-chain dehydrogenase n=1 Tax=Pilimelia terevasa TaxID=53372 RepID=A0A8J3BRC2_9ACTN|nr:SDR family oxidoreductase [Pilimelia terevasa]GGK22206.1 short-chain dehydrogenase [Pilimelia terevasa]